MMCRLCSVLLYSVLMYTLFRALSSTCILYISFRTDSGGSCWKSSLSSPTLLSSRSAASNSHATGFSSTSSCSSFSASSFSVSSAGAATGLPFLPMGKQKKLQPASIVAVVQVCSSCEGKVRCASIAEESYEMKRNEMRGVTAGMSSCRVSRRIHRR